MSVFSLPEEDWATVTRRVARAEGPIAWSWMAFRNPNTKNWELGALCVRGATGTEKRVLRYSSVVIGTEQLSHLGMTTRLEQTRTRASMA
jgi:hypothetical protein